MDAESILETIAAEQGWNDETKLILVLGYIENQGSNDAFADFLQTAADEENADAAALDVD
jgi:hypothetical protein